jgi:hypothetical protein
VKTQKSQFRSKVYVDVYPWVDAVGTANKLIWNGVFRHALLGLKDILQQYSYPKQRLREFKWNLVEGLNLLASQSGF